MYSFSSNAAWEFASLRVLDNPISCADSATHGRPPGNATLKSMLAGCGSEAVSIVPSGDLVLPRDVKAEEISKLEGWLRNDL